MPYKTKRVKKARWSISRATEICIRVTGRKFYTSALRYWEETYMLRVDRNYIKQRYYSRKQMIFIMKIAILSHNLHVKEKGILRAIRMGYFDDLIELYKQNK